jgi:mono/diheme cytochrome c family protein
VRSFVLILAIAGCADAPPAARTDAERYLDDVGFRRGVLVGELVNPSNGYGQLRLDHYAVDWDDLPEWNPSVDGLPALAFDAEAIVDDPIALATLGAQAFTRYPVQLWRAAPPGADHMVTVAGNPPLLASTCATCHSTTHAGSIAMGLANGAIDLGWGPGRLDVTTADGHEPVRIPDLRPVALESYLHADANVHATDVIALAVRIETLIITSHDQAVRPPRIVALALATYLDTLAPQPVAPPASEAAIRGATLFAATCAGCHSSTAFDGEPVALEVVGTDPTVGLSHERGTGAYRVPSLRGVADRAWLLHDGSVSSLAQLLDPARSSPGHRFGQDLSADDRASLVGFLQTL